MGKWVIVTPTHHQVEVAGPEVRCIDVLVCIQATRKLAEGLLQRAKIKECFLAASHVKQKCHPMLSMEPSI